MNIKTAVTFAFLFGISAMVKSQSTSGLFETSQPSVDQKMMYASEDSNIPTYRFVGNTRYLILNQTGETHLYQLESLSSEKQPAVAQYFFSRGTGKVQKLTIKNVKSAFAGDLQFHEALDAEFKSDKELTSNESLPRLAALFEIQEESSLLVSGDAAQK